MFQNSILPSALLLLTTWCWLTMGHATAEKQERPVASLHIDADFKAKEDHTGGGGSIFVGLNITYSTVGEAESDADETTESQPLNSTRQMLQLRKVEYLSTGNRSELLTAGTDLSGNTTYICRWNNTKNGDIVPGKLCFNDATSTATCYIPYEGGVIETSIGDALIKDEKLSWVQGGGRNAIPNNAVLGGWLPKVYRTLTNVSVYIVKATIQVNGMELTMPGAMLEGFPDHAFVPWRGKSVKVTDFDVLVFKE